ncbi:MAG: glutathione S-transferase family protein [Candidatus Competibacteraceae bacterium]|nr:glutathione S-transferase family protein [Candidatus Competibacteraceae bacterium]
MRIYGDLNSGNCLKVKYTADYLGLDYDWIAINIMQGEASTPEFLARNPAAQVPVVEFTDGRCLSQSNAIILYLARDSALIPTDSWQQAKMHEWLFWEQYSHEPTIAVCRFQKVYLGKPDTELDPAKVQKGNSALDLMQQYLQKHDWLVGDSVSVADISLIAYTRLAHEGGFDLSTRPALQTWIDRVEKALKI